MLPASSPSPSRTSALTPVHSVPSGGGRSATLGQWQIALVIGLLLYTLAATIGLLADIVHPRRAYLLMAIPCLLPMLWCGFGYLKNSDGEQDSGLLFSAAGWLMLALALFFKHIAVVRAGADAYSLEASMPAVFIFSALGAVCVATGAVLSWQFWKNSIA